MFRGRLDFRAKAFRVPLLRRSRSARDPGSAAQPLRHLPGLAPSIAPLAALGLAAAAAAYTAAMQPVLQVMRESGANYGEARLAVDLARDANALGVLVPQEAIDKAGAVQSAAQSDDPRAASVSFIALVGAGETTTARTTPAIAGITVLYTVSGTDGYYDSNSQQTDDQGRVVFGIPPGEKGVEDTISVSAVLSGRSAGTLYTW